MGDIYVITCTTNGRRYVGETITTIACRWSHHKASAARGSNDCPALYNAIRAHGIDNFNIEKVGSFATMDELDAAEIRYIQEFNTLVPNGYNISKGGQQSHEHIDQTKQKICSGLRTKTDSDVPMYILRHKRNGCDGYIVAYPGRKKEYFTSTKNTVEQNLELAKAFLKCLIDGVEPPKISRDKYYADIDRWLPPGVTHVGDGRFAVVLCSAKGALKYKYFSKHDEPDLDKRIAMAIARKEEARAANKAAKAK